MIFKIIYSSLLLLINEENMVTNSDFRVVSDDFFIFPFIAHINKYLPTYGDYVFVNRLFQHNNQKIHGYLVLSPVILKNTSFTGNPLFINKKDYDTMEI